LNCLCIFETGWKRANGWEIVSWDGRIRVKFFYFFKCRKYEISFHIPHWYNEVFAGSSEYDGFLKGACGGVGFQFIVFHSVSVRNLDASDDRDGSFRLAHGCNVSGHMRIDGHERWLEGGRAVCSWNGQGLETLVFDYVTKVLMDFLNRRAFENFTAVTRKEIMNQIVRFLDSITGPGKLIENFEIRRFEQDPVQKDRVHLDIHMKPYFPAKNFLIKMDGHKGDEGNQWETEYEQK